MNKDRFPWIALGVGLVLALVLVQSGASDPARENALPLLTLLLISELGFLVTLAGAALGLHRIRREGLEARRLLAAVGCASLTLGFLLIGLSLWPGWSGGVSPP